MVYSKLMCDDLLRALSSLQNLSSFGEELSRPFFTVGDFKTASILRRTSIILNFFLSFWDQFHCVRSFLPSGNQLHGILNITHF